MRLHIPACAIVISVFACGLPSLGAQSLGEVARQEAERRKSIKTEAKVYTNKDLQHVPSAASTPAKPAADAPAAAGASTGGASAGKDASSQPESPVSDGTSGAPKRDQAYWSGRMKDLRTAIERDQTYLDALQSRINALTTDFVNRDDPAQRAVIASDRNRALAELERLKIQTANDGKAIANLEEEARRAGVPPGWLR